MQRTQEYEAVKKRKRKPLRKKKNKVKSLSLFLSYPVSLKYKGFHDIRQLLIPYLLPLYLPYHSYPTLLLSISVSHHISLSHITTVTLSFNLIQPSLNNNLSSRQPFNLTSLSKWRSQHLLTSTLLLYLQQHPPGFHFQSYNPWNPWRPEQVVSPPTGITFSISFSKLFYS